MAQHKAKNPEINPEIKFRQPGKKNIISKNLKKKTSSVSEIGTITHQIKEIKEKRTLKDSITQNAKISYTNRLNKPNNRHS